jgi:demethylmenaquinone methyltransferase/2-methoxy-6-polyprenyl-1,4-benzoquinol methylase
MFDAVAPRYDLLNRIISLGMDRSWRRSAVREALESRPGLVIDVGTGTGDLAFDLVNQNTVPMKVIGLDFSPAMLRIAWRRASSFDDPDLLRFVLSDALRLPLVNDVADVIVSAFVLRNLDSIPDAFAAMAGALRSGGRIVLLEMTPIRQPMFRFVFRLYFRRWVPLLGRLISGHPDAYTWLPESVDGFIGVEELSQNLEVAGFREIRVRKLGLGSVAMHTATRV